MEEFQAENRHNPLPHITLSTTALKLAYRNTVFLSTYTATELRIFLSRSAGNSGFRDCVCGRGGNASSVLSRKGG